jgi:hypothetical protein
MELEPELRDLRWATAPPALRQRILRDARAARRPSLVPPWLAAVERHWLYPGRTPAVAIVVAWLLIASLRFTTPVSSPPFGGPIPHLTDEDMARIEMDRTRLLAELRRVEDEPANAAPQPALLSPRS